MQSEGVPQLLNIHEILMHIQKLEKGLHMPQRRVGFGILSAQKLKSFLQEVQAMDACPTINMINMLNLSEVTLMARRTLEKYQQLRPSDVNSTELGNHALECLSEIVHARHSVRNFSRKPVATAKITKAVHIAQRIPSACNRQPCGLVVVKNHDVKTKLLALHCGSQGFEAPCLGVIVYDKDAFFQDHEELAGAFHAGMFSAGLMWALQAQNISTCALNWHVDVFTHQKAKDILALEAQYDIAMLMFMGHALKKPEADAPRISPFYRIVK